MKGGPIKVLFVCGRNKRRSPTAERVYRADRRLQVRAVGLGETSPRRVTEGDLRWADLVLPMERKHAVRLKLMFPDVDPFPEMDYLEICDDYKFMAPELIEMIREQVDAALESYREMRDGAGGE